MFLCALVDLSASDQSRSVEEEEQSGGGQEDPGGRWSGPSLVGPSWTPLRPLRPETEAGVWPCDVQGHKFVL